MHQIMKGDTVTESVHGFIKKYGECVGIYNRSKKYGSIETRVKHDIETRKKHDVKDTIIDITTVKKEQQLYKIAMLLPDIGDNIVSIIDDIFTDAIKLCCDQKRVATILKRAYSIRGYLCDIVEKKHQGRNISHLKCIKMPRFE
jgi:hypothetical protein